MNCTAEVMSHWETVLNVAMHFNQLLGSTRSLVASVMTAVFGAAAVAAIHLKPEVSRVGKIPLGVLILAGGLCFLFCMFLMDQTYYYRLLIGSVEVAEHLEKKCSALPQITLALSGKVSRVWSEYLAWLYYGFLALADAIFMGIILKWESQARSQAGATTPVADLPAR